MGARGPLKLIDPRTSPSAVPDSVAAEVTPKAPTMPAGVAEDEELAALWKEIVPGLDEAGLLTPADAASVEVMLRHVLTVRMAHREIMKAGTVTAPASDTDIEKKHPAEVIMRLESAAVMQWADKLGMTWMSRARTQAVPASTGGAKGGPSSPFAAPASGE